jgi:hypothetical protein
VSPKFLCRCAMLLRMSAARSPIPDSLTAAEIVATIPAPPDLAMLDQRLAALRSRRDEISRSIDTTSAIRTPPSFFTAARKQKYETETEITETRRQHSELRAAHETTVRAALAPLRSEAVARFDAALAELFAAWGVLDEIAAENSKVAVKNPPLRLTAMQFQKLAGGFIEAARG